MDVLRTLMEAHDLRQKDLVPIFGSESIVSEILHKKRDLNKAHIENQSVPPNDSVPDVLAPRAFYGGHQQASRGPSGWN